MCVVNVRWRYLPEGDNLVHRYRLGLELVPEIESRTSREAMLRGYSPMSLRRHGRVLPSLPKRDALNWRLLRPTSEKSTYLEAGTILCSRRHKLVESGLCSPCS